MTAHSRFTFSAAGRRCFYAARYWGLRTAVAWEIAEQVTKDGCDGAEVSDILAALSDDADRHLIDDLRGSAVADYKRFNAGRDGVLEFYNCSKSADTWLDALRWLVAAYEKGMRLVRNADRNWVATLPASE